jgi:FixJ family two-component response regulator
MTGPELVKRLLALRPDLRVVYSSGCTERAVKGRDLIAGGASFLARPFPPAELVRIVDQALTRAFNP